jgi:hypothetical protein
MHKETHPEMQDKYFSNLHARMESTLFSATETRE